MATFLGNRERTALAALIGIALILRLWRLNEGLWLDEIGTWVRFMHLPLSTIPTVYGSENQHYLFSLLARLSLMIFGESVWAFRLPAVLFGVASIWAVWWFGRIVTDSRESFFSAALLTFSYHHLWFSQNARGYSGLLFWTMLSSGLLLRSLESGSRRHWMLWAMSAAFGVYTHATMAFVLIGQAIISAVSAVRTRRWVPTAVGFASGAVFTLLLHAPAWIEIRKGLKGTVSVVQEWKSPLWAAAEVFRGLSVNFAGAAIAVVAIAVFAVGVVSYARSNPSVVALLMLPPLIGASVVLTLGHHIWPRFFYFAFGFAALVAVRGVALSAGRVHPRAATASLTLLVLLSAISVPAAYGPKQDFDGALAYARFAAAPGDIIATTNIASYVYDQHYHAGFPSIRSVGELTKLQTGSRRVWLIYTLDPVFRAQLPELYSHVGSHAKVARRFPGTLQAGTVTVAVFEPPPASGAQ